MKDESLENEETVINWECSHCVFYNKSDHYNHCNYINKKVYENRLPCKFFWEFCQALDYLSLNISERPEIKNK